MFPYGNIWKHLLQIERISRFKWNLSYFSSGVRKHCSAFWAADHDGRGQLKTEEDQGQGRILLAE